MTQITQWQHSLPASWKALPLKYIAKYSVSNVDKLSDENEIPVELCNYTDVYKNDYITSDIEFMKATATEEEINRFALKVGDVLITKDSESWDDIGVPALVVGTKKNLLCGYHLAIIKPQKSVLEPRFIFRCLQAKQIRIQLELASTGVTRYGLPKDAVGTMLLPLPDLATQKLLADYLDEETCRIDSMILAKKNLLRLLEEKKQALINKAVTKGLDPTAKMKESGIEWIGAIPQSWEVCRLKHVSSKVGSGVTPKGGANVYQNAGIPLLRSQNIYFDGLRLEDVAYISEEIHESMAGSKVVKGDILMNITGGSIGRCFYFDEEYAEANVNQHVCIIRPNRKVITKYLYFFLASYFGQNQVELFQEGGGREGLTFESIKSFIIPLPPIAEQRHIVKVLDERIAQLSSIIQKSQYSLQLSGERKSTLISATVTGNNSKFYAN